MSLAQVSVRFAKDPPRLRIHELTGFDEQCVRDASTATAIALLDRLVERAPQSSWRAAQLTASDRDRLLAAVYRITYGPRIDCTPRCPRCGSLFDLSFLLDDLLATVDRAPAPDVAEALPDGTFRTAPGTRFRLPRGEDELAVMGLPPEEAEQTLLQRCLLDAPPGMEPRAALEDALEEVAPILDLDIQTACPECEARQTVHFNIQFYLLRAIEQERAQIAREMHRIARAYGWSFLEILGLRRSERRLFVELIESELSHRRSP